MLKPWRCLWSVLRPDSMLMPMAMPLPETMWKSMTRAAAADYKGQGRWFFFFFSVISMTSDSQKRMRDIEGFCVNLSSQPPPLQKQKKRKKNLYRKPLTRTLKHCDKDAEL